MVLNSLLNEVDEIYKSHLINNNVKYVWNFGLDGGIKTQSYYGFRCCSGVLGVVCANDQKVKKKTLKYVQI